MIDVAAVAANSTGSTGSRAHLGHRSSPGRGGDLTTLPDVGIEWAFDMPVLVRHLADDLRTFHQEVVAAQPGPGAPNHAVLTAWIFGATALGEAVQAAADHLTALDTSMARHTRGFLIRNGHDRGGTAF